MPRIEPLTRQQLDAELNQAIDHAVASRVLSSTVPVQVWAHCPPAAQAWLGLLQVMQDTAQLSERERELVRLKIASITQCQACQLARKSDTVTDEDIACLQGDSEHFSARENAALYFAHLFAADYLAIDDAVYQRLQAHFSSAEIVELNMYCALMLAGGRMTYVQKAY